MYICLDSLVCIRAWTDWNMARKNYILGWRKYEICLNALQTITKTLSIEIMYTLQVHPASICLKCWEIMYTLQVQPASICLKCRQAHTPQPKRRKLPVVRPCHARRSQIKVPPAQKKRTITKMSSAVVENWRWLLWPPTTTAEGAALMTSTACDRSSLFEKRAISTGSEPPFSLVFLTGTARTVPVAWPGTEETFSPGWWLQPGLKDPDRRAKSAPDKAL